MRVIVALRCLRRHAIIMLSALRQIRRRFSAYHDAADVLPPLFDMLLLFDFRRLMPR